MEIVRFTDEYGLAAGVYDMAPAELRARDERQGQPLQRWLAPGGAPPHRNDLALIQRFKPNDPAPA